MQLVVLPPTLLPHRLPHQRTTPRLQRRRLLLIGRADELVNVLLVILIGPEGLGVGGQKEGLLERVLDFLRDVDEATVDDLALGAVDNDEFALLGVVLVLKQRVDVHLPPVHHAFRQSTNRHLGHRLQGVSLWGKLTGS